MNKKLALLLSLNCLAILVAGGLIALSSGIDLGDVRIIAARNDEKNEQKTEDELAELEQAKDEKTAIHGSTGDGGIISENLTISSGKRAWVSEDKVPAGQLWNENEVTIYRTADIDICVGGGLTGLGEMYWQSSNHAVISGFHSARTWLGYATDGCRYPIVDGIGTTTITAGTYNRGRRDSIKVNVVEIPEKAWKREILTLTNQLRAKNNLPNLEWGSTCEKAAQIRAEETTKNYSHTRPDGSAWSTVCEIPSSGGTSGENLMAGNAAPSPETAMIAWINSPEHLKNLLNPDFTHMAVGLVFDPNTEFQIYWTQFFSTY